MTKTDTQRSPGTRASRLPDELRIAARAAFDKKAQHVTVLDLRKGQAFTDWFLICTGQTMRQVKAIAEAIEDSLRKASARPSHVEGSNGAEWVLMDYFDFVVHVFTPDTREFYALERLWGSAERLELTEADAH
jgi:ribosome-associated protein